VLCRCAHVPEAVCCRCGQQALPVGYRWLLPACLLVRVWLVLSGFGRLVPKTHLHVVCDLQIPEPITAEEITEWWSSRERRKGDRSTPEQAAKIALGTSRAYLSSTLDLMVRTAILLHTIRNWFADGLLSTVKHITDKNRLTLVLLGGAGSGTGLHLDWTQAYNIALALASTGAGDVLAIWVGIAPCAVAAADAWLRSLKLEGSNQRLFPEGLRTKGRVRLDDNMVHQLQLHLSNLHGSNSVVVLEQRHGQVVYMPPGWVHQVTNKEPCVKLAWDYYEPSNFGKYALVHDMAAKLFGDAMADDYVSVHQVVEKILDKAA
jgi:hypothetical protein